MVGTQAGLWRQELKQKVVEPSQLSYLPYTAPGTAPATVGSTLHIKHLLHQSVIRKKQIWPWADLMEAIQQLRFPLPKCVRLTTKIGRHSSQ